jgi:hypothetical protein
LGGIVNDARLAGLIDWSAIEDRTRNLHRLSVWRNPERIIDSAAGWYLTDKWSSQEYRIEVWIEKEALAGVFERICDELEVPFFACRGYTSQSEMWRAAQRLIRWEDSGFKTVILHFGDHDPSGIDMSRDIKDKMKIFGSSVKVRRLALNTNQINQYNPPPNFAKQNDPRFKGYQAEHGDESWELDALEPQVLADMVRGTVLEYRDDDEWEARVVEQEEERQYLKSVANNWDTIVNFMQEPDDKTT